MTTITGAGVTFAYSYTISGSGVTALNAGTVGTPNGYPGIYITGNNVNLTNTGVILGGTNNGAQGGVVIRGTGVRITNQSGGLILGTYADVTGINFVTAGTVVNSGTIASGQGPAGGAANAINLQAGGVVTNYSTGTISGGGVFAQAAATITNAGKILGDSVYGGIYLTKGGTVTNLSGGTITSGGAGYSMEIIGGAATVINAGTITAGSTTGAAVILGTGFTNEVVVDPGAVFIGTVNGGTASKATLELASTASVGTITNLGSFTNFGTVTFDPSAQWLVSVASSGLLSTATMTGFAAGDTLVVPGSVSISHSATNGGSTTATLSGSGAILTFAGTIANFQVSSAGGVTDISAGSPATTLHYGGSIDATGIIAATETVNAGILTLFNGGGTALATFNVGTSLNSSEFTLKSDLAGGTDAIVNTVFGTYASGVALLTNPTTIAASGRVANTATGGKAVSGTSGTVWTLTNFGQVSETASGGIGISFASAGTITNASGGTVTATSDGIALSGGGLVTNATGGVIIGSLGVYAKSVAATVLNAGSINASAGTGAGVQMAAGGQVTNQSGGTITGYAGVLGEMTTTVVNAGSIGANLTASNAIGVWLQVGGTLTNLSGGLITGNYGVAFTGMPATLVNGGTIAGNATSATAGFYANAGGLVTNQSGGAITGFQGVLARSVALTVQNAGSIGGYAGGGNAAGVYLAAGGSVTNQSASSTISGYNGIKVAGAAGTVVNAGVIAGSYSSNYQYADGVNLTAGGTVTNQASGDIYGRNDGVQIAGGRGTVLNLGTIHSHIGGYGGRGVSLDAGGVIINGTSGGTASTAQISGYNYAIQFGTIGTDTLINYGTVYGPTGTVAVSMITGTVINGASGATGALIESGLQSNAVLISGMGTVVNYGTIDGAAANGQSHISYGISLGGSGTVASSISNLGSNALIEGYLAIYAAQNATVTNSGTIEATQEFGGTPPVEAVVFGGGTNRLIVDPGAVFIGTVSGSGPVTLTPSGGGATIVGTANGIGTTTLELASGASAGTMTGLGVQYIGFAAVTVDTSANWTLSGSNTLNSGVTLTNSGTLTDRGTLRNAGAITGTANGINLGTGGILSNQSAGTISGSSIAVFGSGAGTIVNYGTIINTSTSAGQGISLSAGGTVTNKSGGTISGDTGLYATAVAITVVNAGTISETGTSSNGAGLIAVQGGLISNQSLGTISGYRGAVFGTGGAATLSNAGKILGNTAASLGAGVVINHGGSATNLSGGTITGSIGVLGTLIAATVANAGSIGGNGIGVYLQFGGTITNQSGGAISGGADAVKFALGHSNRLVIVPGATFTGTADGGNTIGAASISTLELASGASAGTLSGLGSNYVDFAQVTVDTGARWTLGGTASGFATLTNSGSLASGVTLGAGSVTVSNQSSGTITGNDGIEGGGTATVVNAGRISGHAGGVGAGLNGTLINSGEIDGGGGGSGPSSGAGVDLSGALTNTATGIISGGGPGYNYTSSTGGLGVRLQGELSNSGEIAGGTGGTGGNFTTGGGGGDGVEVITGTLTNTAAAMIAGGQGAGSAYRGDGGAGGRGVDLVQSGVLINDATIVGGQGGVGGYNGHGGSGGGGVYLSQGGTLINHGVIAGGQGNFGGAYYSNRRSNDGDGIALAEGGSITNAASAAITGLNGIYGHGTAAATVLNAGSIFGTNTDPTAAGVNLQTAVLVTNLSGGTIAGFTGVLLGGAATVLNAGVIRGDTAAGRGIQLRSGGTVTNQSGGTIVGGADAVTFAAGDTNRMVFDPGAVFTGTVDGGNTIGATSISTLELASAASAGTLSGLGTKYINFARTTVDTGANWNLNGSNSLVAGATLSIAGTITATGTLRNAGTITGYEFHLSSGTLTNQASGVMTATSVYGVSSGGADYVLNQGTMMLSAGSAIYLKVAGNVSNAAGAVISSGGDVAAVKLKGVDATATNLGVINASATSPGGYGVYMRNGGLITNGAPGSTATASITGYFGVTFKTPDTPNAYGTLVNYGTVLGLGTVGAAVLLSNAGRVFNGRSGATGALIEGGRYGISSGQGEVVNAATIIATGTAAGYAGVAIQGAGTVSNLGTAALIEGYVGVYIGLNGTVTNAGTIESNLGSIGAALNFGGGNARLIDNPGAVFIGSISGGQGGSAVLELTSAGSAGTIVGLGSSVTNFTSLVFDAGAQWTVSGNDPADGLGGLGITGFTVGDTIQLTNFIAANRTFAANTLTLGDGSGGFETLSVLGFGYDPNGFRIAADGGGTDITYQTTPNITADGTASFVGGGPAVTLDGSLSITDPESVTLVSGTVSIGSGFLSGDILSFTSQASIAGSFDSSDGVLTLTGAATVADYQAVLDSITYSFDPSNGDPTGGVGDTSRAIQWLVNDGTAISNTGSSTLNVTHAAATLTAGGTVTFTGGGSAVTLDTGLSVSDPDSGNLLNSGTVSITGFITGDILSADTTGVAVTQSYNAATGVLTLSGVDTLADYQAVLRSVTYSFNPANGDPTGGGGNTSRSIRWSINDGVAVSNIGTSTLLEVHAAPTVSVAGTVSFTGGGTAAVPGPALSVSDPDSGGNLSGATIWVGGSFHAGDRLNFIDQHNVTGSYDSKIGILTLSGTDSLADYQTALRSITYSFSPVNGDPTIGGSDTSRSIDWQVSDSATVSNTGSVTLDVIHAAPTVSASGTVAYTVAGAAVVLDGGATVSAPDSGGNLTGATIQVTGGRLTGDTLHFTNQNGIIGSFDSASGMLTLSGNVSATNYQTALDSITYDSKAADPTDADTDPTRTLSWSVDDGVTVSSVASTTIDIGFPPPAIAGPRSGQAINDAATIAPFEGVSIAEPHPGQTETVTITLTDPTNGALSNLGDGSYDGSTGVFSVSGSAAAVSGIIDGLVFTPTAHQVVPGASVTTGFTIHVADTAGATASDTATTVGATAVNDPPVIAGAASGQTMTDEATLSPFATVSINDVDFGQTETVTVTLSDKANGTLSKLGSGSYDSSTGVYSVTGNDGAVSGALQALVFTPAAHQVAPGGSVTTTFTIAATDTAEGTSSNSATTVGVTAVNDAPVINGATAGQTTSDTSSVSPLSKISISDVDFGQTETVTVTLSDHANGTLSNTGSGSYNGATGVYSITGTDASVSAAVDGLIFTPTPHQVAPGDAVVTTFTIQATDTAGGTASDGSTTLTATAVKDDPVISGVVASQGITDSATATPFSTVTISDADFGQTETVTVALSNPGNGVLSGFAVGGYDSSSGVYTVTGTDAAVSSALDGLVFTPTAHQVVPGASVTTGFTITATDTAGGTSSNGNTTVNATAANDPPQIANAHKGQTVNDNATDHPFSDVTIGDPDLAATEAVTIILTAGGSASDANGKLSGSGLSRVSTGTYTLTAGTPTAVTAALAALQFTPTAHEVAPGATVTTGMTLSVTDGIVGSPTEDTTTSVVTTAINTPPAITGAVANQGVPDQTASHPFATVNLVDPDFGAIETATVTLSAAGNGTLSNLSAGSYNAATGVYSVTGTPTADTAALRALVFTPTAQPNIDVTTTRFTISPGAGGTTDTTTTVTAVRQILGLAVVPASKIAISVSPDGTGFAPAQLGMTNEAVVTDPVESHVYTVPTGYQALFLGGTTDATLSDSLVGAALLVANQGNDELIANAPNDILVAGSGNDSLVGGTFASTVVGGTGAATVFAGSGAMQVIDGSGPISFGGNSNAGSSIFGGSGPGASDLSANLSGQHQTASVGSSAATITAGGSGNLVIGGEASLSVTVTGTANTVQAGSGMSAIVSNGSGGIILGGSVAGSGFLVVLETGNNDTIVAGANPTTVTASTGLATSVVGGSGSLTFVGGIGTATIMGGTGATSVTAGTGGVVFRAGASDNATVDSGAGTVTIFGAAGTTQNLTGSRPGSGGGPNFAVAGSGNETLNAANSAASNWLSVNTEATSAATILIGGSGADTLIAGSAPGSVTMTGGAGSDAFVFFRQAVGGAHDVITDFTPADSVYIEGYGAGSASALQAAATTGPGGRTLTLNDGTTITFANLTGPTELNGRLQYG